MGAVEITLAAEVDLHHSRAADTDHSFQRLKQTHSDHQFCATKRKKFELKMTPLFVG